MTRDLPVSPTPGQPLRAEDFRVGDYAVRWEDHFMVKRGEVHQITEMFRGSYLGFARPIGGEWNPSGWRKCDADGWMPWSGGENPVPGVRPIDVRFPSGVCKRWMNRPEHQAEWADIIAFRLASAEPDRAEGGSITSAELIANTDYTRGAVRIPGETDDRRIYGQPVPPTPAVEGEGASSPFDREYLAREVRVAWVRWAEQQANPKPSWLVPYDGLSEPDKEADRQIGEHIQSIVLAALSSSPPAQAGAVAVDWSDYEDDLSDVIQDSIDMDWTSRDGARAVVRWLQAGVPPTPEEPCLSPDEKAAQAARCACRGVDDYCPCQNAADRQTKKDRRDA